MVSGVIVAVGSGTGNMVAGLILESYTWRHYFYILGAIYFAGLLVHLLFVYEKIETYW